MSLAASLIDIAQIYALIGAVVALAFLTIGIDRIDEDARGAYAFRPLLIPAVLMIWPLILWRWLREELGLAHWRGRHSPPRAAHTVAAMATAGLVVFLLIAGVAIRQTWPADTAPVRLAAPAEASQ